MELQHTFFIASVQQYYTDTIYVSNLRNTSNTLQWKHHLIFKIVLNFYFLEPSNNLFFLWLIFIFIFIKLWITDSSIIGLTCRYSLSAPFDGSLKKIMQYRYSLIKLLYNVNLFLINLCLVWKMNFVTI